MCLETKDIWIFQFFSLFPLRQIKSLHCDGRNNTECLFRDNFQAQTICHYCLQMGKKVGGWLISWRLPLMTRIIWPKFLKLDPRNLQSYTFFHGNETSIHDSDKTFDLWSADVSFPTTFSLKKFIIGNTFVDGRVGQIIEKLFNVLSCKKFSVCEF